MVERKGDEDLRETLEAVIGQSLRPLVPEKGKKSPWMAFSGATSVFIKPVSTVAWYLSIRLMGWGEKRGPFALDFLSPQWDVHQDETGGIAGVVFNKEVVLFRGGGVGTPFKVESVVPQNLVVRR